MGRYHFIGSSGMLRHKADDFYRKNCGAQLEPVLESIKFYKKLGIWIEITTLVIPQLNDSETNLMEIATFIRDVGVDVPWHISRFLPHYQLIDIPPTPIETLRRAREIGLNVGLRYVYVGNVPGEGEDTTCYNCGEVLIKRQGYSIIVNKLIGSKCPFCDVEIDGFWN